MSLLSCSLVGQVITAQLTAGSRLAALYGNAESVLEHTTCNYGLDRNVEEIANMGGMRVAAMDDLGEVRAIERVDHPFFMATLYQPQLRPEQPHPVFVGLVTAATGN